MRERLTARLQALRGEHEKGRETLRDLEAQVSNVRAMMLRISGAIQVLEEELAPDVSAAAANEALPDAAGESLAAPADGAEKIVPGSRI